MGEGYRSGRVAGGTRTHLFTDRPGGIRPLDSSSCGLIYAADVPRTLFKPVRSLDEITCKGCIKTAEYVVARRRENRKGGASLIA